jgi:hypothetical protein
VTVIDSQQLDGRSSDDFQRVLRAAVAQEIGSLGGEQEVEQRGLQRSVLLLEVHERLVVD